MGLFDTESLTENSTTINHHAKFYNFYAAQDNVTGLVLYPVVSFLGFLATILLITVLVRKDMRSSTGMFGLGLAVGEMFRMVDHLFYFVVLLIARIPQYNDLQLHEKFYAPLLYVLNATMMSTAWTMVAITLERVVAIYFAQRGKMLCTLAHAGLTSVCIVLISFLLSTPFVLDHEMVEHQNRSIDNATAVCRNGLNVWKFEQFAQILNWILYAVRSVLPLLLLVILTGFLITGISRVGTDQTNRKINRFFFAIISAFIFSYFPESIMSAVISARFADLSCVLLTTREVTYLLLLMNPIFSLLIYCIFYPQFWSCLTKSVTHFRLLRFVLCRKKIAYPNAEIEVSTLKARNISNSSSLQMSACQSRRTTTESLPMKDFFNSLSRQTSLNSTCSVAADRKSISRRNSVISYTRRASQQTSLVPLVMNLTDVWDDEES